MLDNFREWLSDNLRYILLGLAAILLIVIAFLAVRLIKGLGSPKEKEPKTVQTEADTKESETQSAQSETLQKDVEDVLAWATQYYAAKQSTDYDALGALCEKFDDAARSEVESQDAAIESYTNIMTYAKPGLTKDSYIVYVYFDAKITGSDTLVPALREFYLIRNAEGKLVRADMTAEMNTLVEERRTDHDVQALSEDVNKKFNDALAADEDLAALLSSDQTADPAEDETGSSDEGTVVGTTTGTMQTTTEINVRGEASADATLYGVLMSGTTVEVVENLDNGWSKISYVSNGSTIEGYVMTQYLTSVQ